MKTNYIWAIIAILTLSGCSQELALYDAANDNAIGFMLKKAADTIQYESFIYEAPENKTRLTAYLNVQTIGFVTDYDRTVTLKQVQVEGKMNGVAGVHYLPLTDPEVASKYVIKAGETMAALPIVILYDKALATNDVVIRFVVEENEHFKQGLPGTLQKDIIVTDMPKKPNIWNDYSWGVYGRVKHLFMIYSTGKKWDDEWLKTINIDPNERKYWFNILVNKLNEENEKRKKDNLDVLREDDEAKTKVNFDYWAS